MTRRLLTGISRLACLLSLVVALAAPVSAAEVAVHDLARNPSAFDGKEVTLSGTATALVTKTSHRGNVYTTFKVTDGSDAVSVFSWGRLSVHDGDRVEVRGIFQQVKQVGRYTFHNEVQASSVRATASGTRQRQSRSTKSPSTSKAATSTPSVPAATEAITRCQNLCTAALPPGWYIERLRLSIGTRPVTCADPLDALESEIDDLESEKADLKEECESEE